IRDDLVTGVQTCALPISLAIPYIVEYNGSEISMQRSFEGTGMIYEDVYRAAEIAAFRQATAISVVSAPIADEVASRGVDRCKIQIGRASWRGIGERTDID